MRVSLPSNRRTPCPKQKRRWDLRKGPSLEGKRPNYSFATHNEKRSPQTRGVVLWEGGAKKIDALASVRLGRFRRFSRGR